MTAVDPARYRTVLGHLPTGVTVVAAVDDGEPVGMAVGSFMSVSLDPPLVGFFADHGSSTLPRLLRAGAFCVNVLGDDQEEVCRRFASRGGQKFVGVGWRPGLTSSPILDGVVVYVDCTMERTVEAGDHTLVLGRVVELDVVSGTAPLVFHRGAYNRLGI